MLALLRGLEHLCSLRDRDALDSALVTLVQRFGENQLHAARLIRLVGNEGDLRCLIRAEQSYAKLAHAETPAWTDWVDLPPLAQFPARSQAFAQGDAVVLGAMPCTTVVPLGAARPATHYLEMESQHPLPTQLMQKLMAIARIYQSVESLLDYGEKDALTELLNRKSFDATFLKAAIEDNALSEDDPKDRRVQHAQQRYWLAVLDIDHFKRVNDTFGHLIGDEVLLLVARLMRSSFRFHDQLYRFGGEEFVILMRCAGHDDAASVLERLRQKVAQYDFPQVGPITVSIGFAPLNTDDTPGAAFGRADKAVYHAKAHGRNQVCSYPELVASGAISEEVEVSGEADFF